MIFFILQKLFTGAADNDVSDLFSNVSDISYMSDIDRPNSIQYDLDNGSPLGQNKFKIVHFNIDSITANGKIEAPSEVCNILNISVLVLTETHLDHTIPNNIVSITGYHEAIRHDRAVNGRYGGGCMVYIKQCFTFKHLQNKQSQFFEHVWVDVKSEGKTISINCLYRPPIENTETHQHFLNTTEDILTNLAIHDADLKVVTSDLNFGNCYSLAPPLQYKPLDHLAPDLFSSYGFQQLIDIPTRICLTTTSLIDLIFVNSMELVEEFGTLPQIADHEGTLLCLSLEQKTKKQTQTTIFDYKNADLEGLSNFIKNFDFEKQVFSLPVPDQAEKYSQILISCFDQFVPKKTFF